MRSKSPGIIQMNQTPPPRYKNGVASENFIENYTQQQVIIDPDSLNIYQNHGRRSKTPIRNRKKSH